MRDAAPGFSEHLDLPTIGKTWCDLWATGLARTLAFRRRRPELAERFVDVHYEDLVREPMTEVERIHRSLGVSFPSEALTAVRASLFQRHDHSHRTHTYSLSDYHLTPAMVRSRFAGYDGRRLADVSLNGEHGPKTCPSRDPFAPDPQPETRRGESAGLQEIVSMGHKRFENRSA